MDDIESDGEITTMEVISPGAARYVSLISDDELRRYVAMEQALCAAPAHDKLVKLAGDIAVFLKNGRPEIVK